MKRLRVRSLETARHRMSSILLGSLLASILAVAGCKDDKKISPPPPPGEYLEPSSPANVLANLKTAYTKRNAAEYAKLLAPDYVFRFNPVDVIDPENPLPPQWTREEELDAAQDLFANAGVDTIFLSWTPGVAEPTDTIPDGLRVRADQVNLEVRYRNENHEFLIYQVRGSYQFFYLREDPGTILPSGAHPWAIARWDDMPIGGKVQDTSWGRIKYVFRRP